MFDPTGRPVGVMVAPPGRVAALAFEGNQLTAWVAAVKYTRRVK